MVYYNFNVFKDAFYFIFVCECFDGPAGTGVTDGCKLPCGCWEPNLVLWKSTKCWAISPAHSYYNYSSLLLFILERKITHSYNNIRARISKPLASAKLAIPSSMPNMHEGHIALHYYINLYHHKTWVGFHSAKSLIYVYTSWSRIKKEKKKKQTKRITVCF